MRLCAAWFRSNCAHETCCQNTYQGPGEIAFSNDYPLPGDILPFAVSPGNGWIVTNRSFICGTPNVSVSAKFPGCATCCCGGEGFFLTEVTSDGPGLFYAGGYGCIARNDIAEGQVFIIDTGMFFATHQNQPIIFS